MHVARVGNGRAYKEILKGREGGGDISAYSSVGMCVYVYIDLGR